jgi:hypothetical protein
MAKQLPLQRRFDCEVLERLVWRHNENHKKVLHMEDLFLPSHGDLL